MEEITTEFVSYDTFNRNGMVFTKEAVQKAVKDFQKRIEDGLTLGELGHPGTFSINLPSAAIALERVECEDDKIKVTYKTLTSKGFNEFGIVSIPGDIAVAVKEAGNPLRLDPRFYSEGENIQIITWDLV